MRTFEKSPKSPVKTSIPTEDDKMRMLLKKLFGESVWISGLPSVRAFFAAFISHFEERLSEGRKKGPMPKLGACDIRRELMFLRNLDRPVATVDGDPKTLWAAYEQARTTVSRTSPPVPGMAERNVSELDRRVAQYVHVIRNARRATD